MDISRVLQYVAYALVLVVAIPVHESAHGLVAYWLGDPTAKQAGRISLNPIRHFDLFGSICMLAFGVGWAKPVPIDPQYFRRPKRDMALSALAGPASNLIMAFVTMVLLKLIWLFAPQEGGYGVPDIVSALFLMVIIINISLGIFNMLPFPPFDGSRIYLIFLPVKWYFGVMKYERYIKSAVFILFMLGLFDVPLAFLRSGVYWALNHATSPLGLLPQI